MQKSPCSKSILKVGSLGCNWPRIHAVAAQKNEESNVILFRIIAQGITLYTNSALMDLEDCYNSQTLKPMLELLEQETEGIEFSRIISILGKLKLKEALQPLIRLLGKENFSKYAKEINSTIYKILESESIYPYLDTLTMLDNEALKSGVNILLDLN